MSILQKVYKRTIDTGIHDLGTGNGMDIWQWDEGVAMYGFTKAYLKTKDINILIFMKKWIDKHLDRMDFGYSINTTAPLLGIITLLETGYTEERYIKICDDFAVWCLSKAPRADRGAFEHSCTVNIYDNQIWADTLFMGCLFLLKWGLYINKEIYINEAIRQFSLHYTFLSDKKTGLIYHGYDSNKRNHMGVLWGRGNVWFSVGSVEVLNLIPQDTKDFRLLYNNFLNHIKSIITFQDVCGGWHTVDTYIEMSATAGFTYTIHRAIESGLIDKKYQTSANQALKFLLAHVDKQGNVENGSIGTCVMEDYKKYNEVGVGYSYFTQGLSMMALTYEK